MNEMEQNGHSMFCKPPSEYIKRGHISPFLDTSVVNAYYWVSAWMSSCMWQENIDKEFGCPMDACIVKVSHSFQVVLLDLWVHGYMIICIGFTVNLLSKNKVPTRKVDRESVQMVP